MPFYIFQWTDEIVEHLAQHGVYSKGTESMNKLTKSVSKRVVHSDEQRSQLNALQALIEAEKDELIEIGLRFQREHEAMIAEIVAELNVARRESGLSLDDMQATTGIDHAELSSLLGDEVQSTHNPTLSTLERVAGAFGRRLKLSLTER